MSLKFPILFQIKNLNYAEGYSNQTFFLILRCDSSYTQFILRYYDFNLKLFKIIKTNIEEIKKGLNDNNFKFIDNKNHEIFYLSEYKWKQFLSKYSSFEEYIPFIYGNEKLELNTLRWPNNILVDHFKWIEFEKNYEKTIESRLLYWNYEEDKESTLIDIEDRYIQMNYVETKTIKPKKCFIDANYIHFSRVNERKFIQVIQGCIYDEFENCYVLLIKYNTNPNHIVKEKILPDRHNIPFLFAVKQYFIRSEKNLPPFINNILNYPNERPLKNSKYTFDLKKLSNFLDFYIFTNDFMDFKSPVPLNQNENEIMVHFSDKTFVWNKIKKSFYDLLKLDPVNNELYFSPRTIIILRHFLFKKYNTYVNNKKN